MSKEEYEDLLFQKAISLVLCGECRFYPYQKINFADDKLAIETYEHCYYMEADDFCSKGEFSPQTVKKEVR